MFKLIDQIVLVVDVCVCVCVCVCVMQTGKGREYRVDNCIDVCVG